MLRKRVGWQGTYRWGKDSGWNKAGGWNALAVMGQLFGFYPGLIFNPLAGTAFIQLYGLDISAYVGVEGTSTPWKITLIDSAGLQAVGYIGAAGAAETLSGTELVGNPGFETITSGTADDGISDNFGTWVEAAQTSILDSTATVHGGTKALKIIRANPIGVAPNVSSPVLTVTAVTLYKFTLWARGTGVAAGSYRLYDSTAAGFMEIGRSTNVTGTTYTQVIRYFVTPANCIAFKFYLFGSGTASDTIYFDDISIQAVTDCAATGAHVVSAKNGSVRNWTSIETGFSYNGSAYRVEISRA